MMMLKAASLLLLLPLVFAETSDVCAQKVDDVKAQMKESMEQLNNKVDKILNKFNRVLLTNTELNRKLEKITAKLTPISDELNQCIKRTSFAPISIPHKDCALGIQTGYIEDSAITASSHHKTDTWVWLPSGARLFKKDDFDSHVIGGWCPDNNTGQMYLQIDLERPQEITHVATQGRYNFNVYTKSFRLSYSSDGKNFTVYQEGGMDKEFTTSRTSGDSLAYNTISSPFITQHIRFLPSTWEVAPCLRVELYSCGKK